MSMAVSLEVRSPLLDYEVVELMARAPVSYKLRGDVSKVALRRLAERLVPRSTSKSGSRASRCRRDPGSRACSTRGPRRSSSTAAHSTAGTSIPAWCAGSSRAPCGAAGLQHLALVPHRPRDVAPALRRSGQPPGLARAPSGPGIDRRAPPTRLTTVRYFPEASRGISATGSRTTRSPAPRCARSPAVTIDSASAGSLLAHEEHPHEVPLLLDHLERAEAGEIAQHEHHDLARNPGAVQPQQEVVRAGLDLRSRGSPRPQRHAASSRTPTSPVR